MTALRARRKIYDVTKSESQKFGDSWKNARSWRLPEEKEFSELKWPDRLPFVLSLAITLSAILLLVLTLVI